MSAVEVVLERARAPCDRARCSSTRWLVSEMLEHVTDLLGAAALDVAQRDHRALRRRQRRDRPIDDRSRVSCAEQPLLRDLVPGLRGRRPAAGAAPVRPLEAVGVDRRLVVLRRRRATRTAPSAPRARRASSPCSRGCGRSTSSATSAPRSGRSRAARRARPPARPPRRPPGCGRTCARAGSIEARSARRAA